MSDTMPTKEVVQILSSLYEAQASQQKDMKKTLDKINERLDCIERKHVEEQPVWDTIKQIGTTVKKVGIWFIIATIIYFVVTEAKNIVKFGVEFINPAR